MDYEFKQNDGIDVITVKGNVLTGQHNQAILSTITEKIKGGSRKMVIEMGASGFINSNGLNLLLNILTKYRKAGGEVVLAKVSPELMKLLDLTKLSAVFIMRDDVESASTYLSSL